MQEIWGRIKNRRNRPQPAYNLTDESHHEAERAHVAVEVIDETDPENLLSRVTTSPDLSTITGMSHLSTEGFAENPEAQAQLAQFLIDRLSLASRGPLLDVGFGANLHVSGQFVRNGIEAYGLDVLRNGSQYLDFVPPRQPQPTPEGVITYQGDIALLDDPGSALRDNRFGTILFNGSWAARANNFTVSGEMVDFKAQTVNPDMSVTAFRDDQKTRILDAAVDHLSPTGVIGVVSARYAFHGGGYGFSNLPDEKLDFLELFSRLQEKGAKQVKLVGVSQAGFDRIAQSAYDLAEKQAEEDRKQQTVFYFKATLTPDDVIRTREALRSIDKIPIEDSDFKFGDDQQIRGERNKKTIESTRTIDELNQLARIDALFASF